MTSLKLAGIATGLVIGSALVASDTSAADKGPPEIRYEQTQTLFSPAPRYPAEEEKAGVSGEAVIIATVASDGKVAAVKIEQSSPAAGFGAAAAEAVSEWKFNPETKTGQHAPFIVHINFVFMATD